MHSYVQLLGGGAPDIGRSLLIFFDARRYLLGCGEGTQRFCTQHQIRLNKLHAILLPSLEWSEVGGLAGMLCTVADAGMERLTIIGPTGTIYLLATFRPFVRREGFIIEVIEVEENAQDSFIYQDDCITVRATEILPKAATTTIQDQYLHSREEMLSTMNLVEIEWINTFHALIRMPTIRTSNDGGWDHHFDNLKQLSPFFNRKVSLLFHIQGPSITGKFNVQRAKELGIPPGRLYGRLASGESIVLEDGRAINSSEFVGPSVPGGQLMVACLPTTNHLATFTNFFRPNDSLKILLCDRPVFEQASDEIKREWRWNEDLTCSYPSAQEILEQLHADLILKPIISPMYSRDDIIEGVPSLCKFQWHPPPYKLLSATTATKITPNIDVKKSQPIFPTITEATPTNPVITFLGTGAALPGKYRNVSSTLVDFGDAAFLLDCGEGTLGQLYRRFGEHLEGILERIARGGIIISHMHADHHMGVPMLLSRGCYDSLPILAPKRYNLFLQELSHCTSLKPFKFYPIHDGTEVWESIGGLDYIAVVPAIHCPRAFGFILQRGNIQIVFSGDGRPCEELVFRTLGLAISDALLTRILIHEATFNDDLKEEALDKRHSTISEAIEIGIDMDADFTLLTHFSQRFAKCIPQISIQEYNNLHGSPVQLLPALDMMSVSLKQLQTLDLPGIVAKLGELLPTSDDEEKE